MIHVKYDKKQIGACPGIRSDIQDKAYKNVPSNARRNNAVFRYSRPCQLHGVLSKGVRNVQAQVYSAVMT